MTLSVMIPLGNPGKPLTAQAVVDNCFIHDASLIYM